MEVDDRDVVTGGITRNTGSWVESARDSSKGREAGRHDRIAGQQTYESAAVGFAGGVESGGVDAERRLEVVEEVAGE